jgi:hypothetical protein
MFKETEISIVVKLKRLQWAGHLQRMDEQNLPKRVFTGQKFGKRTVGKRKKRWIDSVEVIEAKELENFKAFWDVAPCSQVEVDRLYRGAYCFHHQGGHDGGST